MSPKVVLDEDDIRRTLVRIGHEIVEKNPEGDLAIVGIHTRGAVLAARLHRLVSELLDDDVPLGGLDIALYRDDLATRGETPVVRATELPSRSRLQRRPVDDVLYTGRTVRARSRRCSTTAARPRAARRPRRPRHRELPIRPTIVGKNLPTTAPSASTSASTELDGVDEVTSPSSRKRRPGHSSRSRTSIARGHERILDRRRGSPRSPSARSRRCRRSRPAGCSTSSTRRRPARARRSSWPPERSPPRGRSTSSPVRLEPVEKGESLKDTVQDPERLRPDLHRRAHARTSGPPSSSRLEARGGVNAGDGKHEHPTQALLVTSPRCASGSGSLDGATIWIVGDVMHSRVGAARTSRPSRCSARA
jgi:pyrimidine operon attenuation protein/uracil phosphoribosyltransferase